MNRRLLQFALAGLLGIGAQSAFAAPTCSLHASNVGIDAFSCTFNAQTNTFTIAETFTSTGIGAIVFNGLDSGVNYTVNKIITNGTSTDWTRISNELLDPSDDGNDAQDPGTQPGFVPAGFSTSNDFDGLSSRKVPVCHGLRPCLGPCSPTKSATPGTFSTSSTGSWPLAPSTTS